MKKRKLLAVGLLGVMLYQSVLPAYQVMAESSANVVEKQQRAEKDDNDAYWDSTTGELVIKTQVGMQWCYDNRMKNIPKLKSLH